MENKTPRRVLNTIVKACPVCGREFRQFPRPPGRPRLYCTTSCQGLAALARYHTRKRNAVTPSAHTGGAPTKGERT